MLKKRGLFFVPLRIYFWGLLWNNTFRFTHLKFCICCCYCWFVIYLWCLCRTSILLFYFYERVQKILNANILMIWNRFHIVWHLQIFRVNLCKWLKCLNIHFLYIGGDHSLNIVLSNELPHTFQYLIDAKSDNIFDLSKHVICNIFIVKVNFNINKEYWSNQV